MHLLWSLSAAAKPGRARCVNLPARRLAGDQNARRRVRLDDRRRTQGLVLAAKAATPDLGEQ